MIAKITIRNISKILFPNKLEPNKLSEQFEDDPYEEPPKALERAAETPNVRDVVTPKTGKIIAKRVNNITIGLAIASFSSLQPINPMTKPAKNVLIMIVKPKNTIKLIDPLATKKENNILKININIPKTANPIRNSCQSIE